MKKRLISLCLLFAMLLSLSLTAQASIESLGEISTEEPVLSKESAVADRLEDMIFHFYCDVPGQYTVGDAIEIYNADTEAVYYMIPIFRGQECVGLAEMSNDGDITLTDGISLYDNIIALDYPNSLLYTTGGVVYGERPGTVVPLYDFNFNISANSAFVQATFAEKAAEIAAYTETALESMDIAAVVTQIEAVNVFAPEVSLMGAVPTVETDQCPITNFVPQNGYLICWAACIATIANYKKGLSLTAEAVATAMGHNYTDDQYAGAKVKAVVDAFALYGMTYSEYSAKLGWTQVKSNIANRSPFIMGITRSVVLPDGTIGRVGHMMTGYGYNCNYGDAEADSGARYIRVWDPYGAHFYWQYNADYYRIGGYLWEWSHTFID